MHQFEWLWLRASYPGPICLSTTENGRLQCMVMHPCASRAEQQAERSRALADEDVSRIKGQLLSLSSMHQADATAAQPQSSPPTHAAHHPGIDRRASTSDVSLLSQSLGLCTPSAASPACSPQPWHRAAHSHTQNMILPAARCPSAIEAIGYPMRCNVCCCSLQ